MRSLLTSGPAGACVCWPPTVIQSSVLTSLTCPDPTTSHLCRLSSPHRGAYSPASSSAATAWRHLPSPAPKNSILPPLNIVEREDITRLGKPRKFGHGKTNWRGQEKSTKLHLGNVKVPQSSKVPKTTFKNHLFDLKISPDKFQLGRWGQKLTNYS